MTQRPPSSDAVALRLVAAGLPAAVWVGARNLYRSALSLIEGQRAWRIQRERIRNELLVVREANRIVAAYATRSNELLVVREANRIVAAYATRSTHPDPTTE